MPDSRDALARELISFARDQVLPLLKKHEVPTAQVIEETSALLEKALGLKARVNVGFVGESQVGKSTLINSILERRVLPSGGIGPLTAQATEVTYAAEAGFDVSYHDAQRLNRLAFGIERYLERIGSLEPRGRAGDAEGLPKEDEREILRTLEQEEQDGEAEREERKQRRTRIGDYMVSQGRLMLAGDAESSATALDEVTILDGIRAVLGHAARGSVERLDPIRARIDDLRRCLGSSERIEQQQLGGPKEFNAALKLRAADWLSPLVKSLKVRLDVPVLEQVTLVDLPGIGVVGDPAARVAQEFVSTRGDALVVVTTNSGLKNEVAKLLEDTDVITKLLFGSREGLPSVQVVIAVTHLDDVVSELYDRLEDEDEPAPDPHELFASKAREMENEVRTKFRTVLKRSEAFDELSDSQRARREEIVDDLLASMRIVCVSARDYLHISRGRADRAFLKEAAATGVPTLIGYLGEMGERVARYRREAIEQGIVELRDGMREHLVALARTYEEGAGRATAGWERFREDMGRVAAALTSEMVAAHGAAMNELERVLPKEIELLCRDAESAGLRRLQRLQAQGWDLHYRSLQAALRGMGYWQLRSVDYPGQLTRALVDSVASDWQPKVVEGVRKVIADVARRDLQLVQKLCDEASARDDRIVADSHIAAQRKLLQQHSKSCVRWTEERLQELREEIHARLSEVVHEPIASACLEMLKDEGDRGPGAKRRILGQFERAGGHAVVKAAKAANALLLKHYEVLQAELVSGYLAEHQNPVGAALDALTNEELMRARRSDAQHRRRVTAAVQELTDRLSRLGSQEAVA